MSRLFNDSLNMTKRYSTIAGLNIQPRQVTLALLTTAWQGWDSADCWCGASAAGHWRYCPGHLAR